ncbi:sugar ABC transporter substrate-binding protein [Paenibacillus jiagnxiensis]|uniref:sugar ABC transporter substrate-binding protein n=1 Tax=Paenibacillus jiagnxiensis TaxID=3228926 RepID=UPI0033A439F5
MKKLSILSLVTAGALAFTACSNGQEASSGMASAEVTEIHFITHSNWEKSLTPVIAAFEKEHPEIKVDVQYNPYTKLTESNEVKLAAGATDLDVVTVDVPLTANYTVKGYLEPLDQWFSQEEKANWTESAVESGSYQGHLMSVPMNTSGVVLFYNKDLFEQAGIDYPSADTKDRMTWEQATVLARKLTRDNVYGFSFDQIGRAYQLLPLLQSKGAQVLDSTGLVSTGYTNSQESIDALTYYYNLFNVWKVSPKIKREEAPDYFTSGKVAMFLSNTANLNKIEESGIHYGIAPHPYFEGGETATPTGSLNLGISSYSTHKEEAAEFVKYVTQGEGAEILFENSGQVPALRSLLEHVQTDSSYDDLPGSVIRLAASEAATTAVNRPSTPGYLEWESNFNKAAEDIKNGTDPRQALDSAASLIDSQLRKYSSVGNK